MADNTPTARQQATVPLTSDDAGFQMRRAAVRAADRACSLPTVGGEARFGVYERGAW